MNFLFNLLADEATKKPNNALGMLIWIIPIGLIIVFMIINSRQRKKQQAEAEEKMSKLKVGDRVKTIGLVYGEIVEVNHENDTFVIKTGSEENPSFLTIDKMAVYQVIPDPSQVADDAENADKADNAENAENADKADNAENTENAENAENATEDQVSEHAENNETDKAEEVANSDESEEVKNK